MTSCQCHALPAWRHSVIFYQLPADYVKRYACASISKELPAPVPVTSVACTSSQQDVRAQARSVVSGSTDTRNTAGIAGVQPGSDDEHLAGLLSESDDDNDSK
jgi:hypothetical protein